MADDKEFTYADVAEHKERKNIYVVVHDKVYNASTFVDEHPGGEEVLMDVAGEDATDAFEDVGHSDEAREILNGLLVGKLKRQPGDPSPSSSSSTPKPQSSGAGSSGGSTGLGVGLYAAILVGGAIAYWAYAYMQKQVD